MWLYRNIAVARFISVTNFFLITIFRFDSFCAFLATTFSFRRIMRFAKYNSHLELLSKEFRERFCDFSAFELEFALCYSQHNSPLPGPQKFRAPILCQFGNGKIKKRSGL